MQLDLRGRLILGTTTLIAGFVAVAAAVFVGRINDFAAREVDNSVAEGHRNLGRAIERLRVDLREETDFLAQTPLLTALASIEGVDQATLEDGFDAIQSDGGNDQALIVLDDKGQVRGRRNASFAIAADMSNWPGVEAALTGTPNVQLWHDGATLMFAGLAPIVADDAVAAVLVRGIPVDDAFAGTLGSGIGNDLVLMHEGRLAGQVWLRHSPTDLLIDELATLRHGDLPSAGRTASIEVDGQSRPGLAVRLTNEGIVAFLPHDVDAIVQLRDEAILYLLALGAIVTLIGLWFASRTARRLSQPLRRLVLANKQLAMGDLGARVKIDSQDEVGRLGESFNTMATTMQKLVDEAADKAVRAEAANRAKDGFLMSISHELRTPLTGIQTSAEMLQEFGDSASSEDRTEFLGTILEQAERLGARISDALEYASLASDRTEWTVSNVDVVELCRNAQSRLAGVLQLKPIEWRLEAAAVHLSADRERVTDAIYHVLHNAWQWSPKDGVVEIRVTPAEDDVAVEILDRGPGIPEADQSRIFEEFTQGGDVLVDKPQGIGIGLRIAMEVALAHGGTIDYQDRDGGGAHFTLRLSRRDRPIDTRVEPVDSTANA